MLIFLLIYIIFQFRNIVYGEQVRNNNSASIKTVIWENLTIDFRLQIIIIIFIICLLFKKYFCFWREILIAAIMGGCVLITPVLNFFISIVITLVVLLLNVSYFDKYISFRNVFAINLWQFLTKIGVINYLTSLYYTFFGQKTKMFYFQTFIIYIFCIIYLWSSKYLFLHKGLEKDLNLFSCSLLYLSLVFGLLSLYIRSLIFASILVVDLKPIYNIVEGLFSDPIGVCSPPSTTVNKALVSYHNHTHQHNYAEIPKKASVFKRLGLFAVISGVGIAGYAAYQQRLQTIISQDGVRAQEINNREMIRQNDLEEVSQGLMSKEHYQTKYSQTKYEKK